MFTINDINILSEYGLTVLLFDGWGNIPKRKGNAFHSYPTENGIEPFVEESDLIWESRNFTLNLDLVCDISEVDAKQKAFKDFLMSTDTFNLQAHSYMTNPIECVCVKGGSFEPNTAMTGQTWGSYKIEFLEVEPKTEPIVEDDN